MNSIWTSVKALLKEKVPGHSYRMWIEPITCCQNEDGDIVLACPNLFSKRRIADHYGQLIDDAVANAAGRALKVRLTVGQGQMKPCRTPSPDRQMKLPDMDAPANGGRLL